MLKDFFQRENSEEEKQTIYKLITQLEEAYQRGEMEPDAYQAKREKLLERLE